LPLDLADNNSIENFATKLKSKYPEGIDILLNNAGFAFKGDAWGEQVAA
jgi:short-subunit dehydrogenase involved in D-alanine esterification of teichoic acids